MEEIMDPLGSGFLNRFQMDRRHSRSLFFPVPSSTVSEERLRSIGRANWYPRRNHRRRRRVRRRLCRRREEGCSRDVSWRSQFFFFFFLYFSIISNDLYFEPKAFFKNFHITWLYSHLLIFSSAWRTKKLY